MAAEQDLKLEQPADAEASDGGKKKLIIIILAVLLLIGGAVGATVFLMIGGTEESTPAEEATVAEEPEVDPALSIGPAQYIKMKPEFIVNYNVGTRQRFLQVSIEIMTRSQPVIEAIEMHNPMFRNDIIRILSDQEFKSLRTPEGRIALQTQLKDHLSSALLRESGVEGGVEAVLFTNLVMQ